LILQILEDQRIDWICYL